MKMIILSEEDFVKVSDTKDIQPLHMKEVQVDGEKICIVNVDRNTMLLAAFVRMNVALLQMALLKATKLNVHGMVPNLM